MSECYAYTADTNWDIENITPKEMMKQIEQFQNVMPKGLMIPIETFKNYCLKSWWSILNIQRTDYTTWDIQKCTSKSWLASDSIYYQSNAVYYQLPISKLWLKNIKCPKPFFIFSYFLTFKTLDHLKLRLK